MSLLEKYAQSSTGDAEKNLKVEVREIIRAYRHVWDVYAELLQNAVDAINRRYRLCNDPAYYDYERFRQDNPGFSETFDRGHIEIEINVGSRTITVRDNGVGMGADMIDVALLPKQSRKRISVDYGFKGYGLTFVAFVTQSLRITSKYLTATAPLSYSLDNAFQWISDEGGTVAFPTTPADPMPTNLSAEWGTEVVASFDVDYTNRFSACAALDRLMDICKEPNQLDRLIYVLRTRTAVGNTKFLFSSSPIVPIEIKLKVTFSGQTQPVERNVSYQYQHPREHAELLPRHECCLSIP